MSDKMPDNMPNNMFGIVFRTFHAAQSQWMMIGDKGTSTPCRIPQSDFLFTSPTRILSWNHGPIPPRESTRGGIGGTGCRGVRDHVQKNVQHHSQHGLLDVNA